MPRLPGPYWYGSRDPGVPCWTFTHEGKRYHSYPDLNLGPGDRSSAMAWYMGCLRALDPTRAWEVTMLRRRAGNVQRASTPHRSSAVVEEWEAAALRRLAKRMGVNPHVALKAAILGEHARHRAGGRLPKCPAVPARPTVRLSVKITPEFKDEMDEMTRVYCAAWKVSPPSRTSVLRIAIVREDRARAKRPTVDEITAAS